MLCCKLCCNLQAIASKRRIPTPRLNARTLHATYSHSLCRLYWLNQNFFVSLALTVLSLFNCYSAHVVGPSAVWSCVFVSFLALLLVLMPFFYCQQFMLCLEFFTLHIFTFFFCFFFSRFFLLLHNKFLLLSYLWLVYIRNIVIVAGFLTQLLYHLLGLNALLTTRLRICMRLMSMLLLYVLVLMCRVLWEMSTMWHMWVDFLFTYSFYF